MRSAWVLLTALAACAALVAQTVPRDRGSAIPPDAEKVLPGTDAHPPILHSAEWHQPVPLPAPVNTAGAEDAPYISADGKTLWFFFTPDVRVPPQKQLLDGVTGIYETRKTADGWTVPRRLALQKPGQLALDGAPCVQGDTLWFCSARQGNFRGVDMWIASRKNGVWTDWRNAGQRLNKELKIGEVHLTADGRTLYFHAERPEGKGKLDIWRTRLVKGEWVDPEPIEAVNTAEDEGWPFITPDGRELWFLRTTRGAPGIYRSRIVAGRFSPPELIVSQFAGEPTLDREGNLYFVHHFFRDGRMIEADIYFARKQQPRRSAR